MVLGRITQNHVTPSVLFRGKRTGMVVDEIGVGSFAFGSNAPDDLLSQRTGSQGGVVDRLDRAPRD